MKYFQDFSIQKKSSHNFHAIKHLQQKIQTEMIIVDENISHPVIVSKANRVYNFQ